MLELHLASVRGSSEQALMIQMTGSMFCYDFGRRSDPEILPTELQLRLFDAVLFSFGTAFDVGTAEGRYSCRMLKA